MTAGVYAIVNGSTERTYIGSSSRLASRWIEHRSRLRAGTHTNRALQTDWNECGERMFAFVALESVDDKQTRLERETLHLRVAHQPYNARTDSSTGRPPGFKVRPEVVEKVRSALKGRPKSASHRAAISAAKRGKPCPAQSLALKGRTLSPETREKMRLAHLGKKGTPESRAKQRAAQLGRAVPPEARQAISAAKKGKPWSASRRAAFESMRRIALN